MIPILAYLQCKPVASSYNKIFLKLLTHQVWIFADIVKTVKLNLFSKDNFKIIKNY